MYASVKFLVSTLLAAGVSMSGAPLNPVTTPHTVLVQSAATTISTFIAEDDFRITTAAWVTHSVGVGLGNETLSLVIDGSTACSFTVSCLAAAGTEVTKNCNVDVVAGQDVDWTRSGCTTAALGSITYQVVQ